MSSSNAFTIGHSQQRDSFNGRTDSPGPAQYDDRSAQKLIREQSPEWKFSQTGRPKVNGEGPDQDSMRQNNTHSQSFTMGGRGDNQASNYGRYQQEMPGPGQYNAQNNHMKSPSYTIGSRQATQDNTNNPGPGSYSSRPFTEELHGGRASSSNIGFGSKAAKSSQNGGNGGALSRSQIGSPGPGQYQPTMDQSRYSNPNYGFSQGPRGVSSRDLSPGPGAYDDSNMNQFSKNSIQVSMGGRPQTAKPIASPGPGQYDPSSDRNIASNSKHNYSAMKSKVPRQGNFSRDFQSPGPGQYNASEQLVREKTPVVSFTSSKRDRDFGRGSESGGGNGLLGPGSYNVQSSKQGPKYTMGQVARKQTKNNNPGPGNYDVNNQIVKDAIRSFKIGNTSKNTISNNGLFSSKSTSQIVGPGSYNPANQEFGKTAPKFTMKGRPNDDNRNKSPGPGAYEPNTSYTRDKPPTYSMKNNKRDMSMSRSIDIPGPGSYQQNDQHMRASTPSCTLGQRKSYKYDTLSPGPGYYNGSDSIVKNQVKSFKMSTTQRQEIVAKEKRQTPGPGNYANDKNKFGDSARKATIKGRPKDMKKDKVPGPGNYNPDPNKIKDTTRSYKMGNSKRQDLVSSKTKEMPGPGMYESPSKFGSNAPTYSIQSKRQNQKRDLTPGPGSYDVKESLSKEQALSYKMGSSVRKSIVDVHSSEMMPGPGSYQQEDKFGKNGAHYSMTQKSTYENKNRNPGPGEYDNTNLNQVKDSVRVYRMSSTSRQDLVSKEAKAMPGPGNYHNSDEFGKDAKSFTIRDRREEKIDQMSPGPGNYNPDHGQVKDNVVSYKMSNSVRQDLVSKESRSQPGPGNYSSPDRFGKEGKSFTMQGKPANQNNNGVPGPGEYDFNLTQVKDSVVTYKMSQSHRQEIVSKEARFQVGPGAYTSPERFGKEGKSFTMQGKPAELNNNHVPGPGEYDYNMSQVKDSVVTHKMSQSQRQEIVSKESRNQVGPGTYSSPERFGKDGKSFTMQGKPADQNNNHVPGPGEYDYNMSQVKDNVVTYKMGQSQRQEIVSKEARSQVGPGAYTSPERFGKDGKSFTMQGKPADQNNNHVPGPGEYDYNMSQVKDNVVTYKMSQSNRQEIVSKEARGQVGPGTYNSPEKFGKEGKSFTMQGKPADQANNNVPGPGEYDQNLTQVKDSVITYKMSQSQRQEIVSKEARNQVGPGAYSSPERFGKEGKSFTMQGKPADQNDNHVPGPGEYDYNYSQTKESVVTHKMSSSTRQDIVSKEARSQVGPGAYSSPEKFGKEGKSFTMQGKPADQNNNNVPGPGEYDQNVNQIKDSVVTYKISQSTRQDIVSKEARNQVGPGAYDSPERFGKDGKSFTIQGKSNDTNNDNKPGPGEYDQNYSQTKESVVAYRMSQSTRQDIVSKEARSQVGPGAYSSPERFGKEGKSFTIQGKPADQNNDNKPGPGEYDQNFSQTKESVKAYKISQSSRQDIVSKEARNQVGPGAYDSPERFGKDGKTFTIQGKPADTNNNNVPGPGEYDQNFSQTKDSVTAYKIRQSTRQDIVSKEARNQVGPGAYDSPERFGKDGKTFTIQGKPADQNNNNVPGPGEYEQNFSQVKDNVVSYKISQSTRQDIVSKEARNQVGPGTYSSPDKFGKEGKSFTMQGKPADQDNNNFPGPGEYDQNFSQIKDSVVSHKISSSTRQEIVAKEDLSKPGPGHYDSPERFGKEGQSFVIAGKSRDLSQNNNPGPGEYQESYSQTKEKVQSYKISTSQRQDMVSQEQRSKPGPGAYSSPERFGQDGQSFKIQGRPNDQQNNNVPGPGEYDQNYSQVKDNVVSYKIGQSNRQEIVSKEARNYVGPGAYDSPERFGQDGQSFKIQGRPNDQQNNNVPGPGEYDYNYSQVKDNVVSYKISQSNRQEIVSKEARGQVGPGAYDSPERFGKEGKSFAIQGKPADINNNNIPGPGEYDENYSQTKDRVQTHKISQSQRQDFVSKEARSQVGPGHYDSPERFGKEGQSYTIGGKGENNYDNKVPGPGYYEQDVSATKDRVVSHKISQSQRDEFISQEMRNRQGPGAYDTHDNFGYDAQGFQIRGRPQEVDRNRNPGPGEYELDMSATKDKVISHKISQSQRDEFVSSEMRNRQGPGAYDTHDNFGYDAQGFQIRGRPQEIDQNRNPGPGEYSPSTGQTRDRVISYNMSKSERQDIISNEQKAQLGPGAYDYGNQFGANGQSFTIQGKAQDLQNSNIPGPGAYTVNDSQVRYSSPSHKISQGNARGDLVTNEQRYQPGPGNYDQESYIGRGQAAQIRGRPSPDRDNGLPGPGEYNAKYDIVKDKIQAASLGKSSRDFLTVQEGQHMGGPGSYNVANLNSGLSFTIQGAVPTNYNNNIPGPGQYQADPNIVKDRIQSVDFGRQSVRDDKSISPERQHNLGPGQYDDRNNTLGGGDAIVYSFSKSGALNQDQGYPGPGHYKIPTKFADIPPYSVPKQNEEFKYV